jgi:hypothetical protein
MRTTVDLAADNGVRIGVHMGLPEMDPSDAMSPSKFGLFSASAVCHCAPGAAVG